MIAIETRNLSKTYQVYQKKEGVFASVRGLFHRDYKQVKAVNDVSFTIEQGEMVAFLGPNGAGKTTNSETAFWFNISFLRFSYCSWSYTVETRKRIST